MTPSSVFLPQKIRFAAALTAVVFLCAGCSMLIRQDPQKAQAEKSKTEKPSGGLTPEQIESMSPDELKAYYEREQKKKEAKNFSEGLHWKGESRAERKQTLFDTSRKLSPEEQGSVFPWHSEPGFRSESLRGTRTFSF